MSDLDAKQWIALLIERARDLRAAGVTSLTIGDTSITLAPFEDAPAQTGTTTTQMTAMERIAAGETDGTYLDVLDDPKTYGRTNGTPGFERPAKDDQS